MCVSAETVKEGKLHGTWQGGVDGGGEEAVARWVSSCGGLYGTWLPWTNTARCGPLINLLCVDYNYLRYCNLQATCAKGTALETC